MRKLLATLAFLLWPALGWAANCTISGKVFNPDGSAIVNGTIQFDSVVQQTLQGGVTIPRTTISTITDATGAMRPIAIVQGIQGQFVFCAPSAGGCGNPTPVLIPVAASADISAILIGIQLSSGGNVVASSLNVSGNSTMGGTLTVTGLATLNGGLNVTGNTSLSGALNVTGATQLGATTAPSLTLNGTTGNVLTFPNGSIDASGNITTTGTLHTGAATLGNVTGGVAQFTQLGIGAAPAWNLDVQVNQNATTEARVYNNNAGASAAAVLAGSNGTCETDMGTWGTGATPSGSPFYTANRNFVLGGCPNGLLIQAAGTSAMLYLSAPNGNNVEVLGNQHFLSANNNVSHPTPGSCGTGPSVTPASTDEAGFITAGSGTVTSCQVVFAAAFPQVPPCTCSTVTIGTWCTANPSTSGVTLTTGTSVAGSNIAWHCWGNV